jgi:hypothetical protein
VGPGVPLAGGVMGHIVDGAPQPGGVITQARFPKPSDVHTALPRAFWSEQSP